MQILGVPDDVQIVGVKAADQDGKHGDEGGQQDGTDSLNGDANVVADILGRGRGVSAAEDEGDDDDDDGEAQLHAELGITKPEVSLPSSEIPAVVVAGLAGSQPSRFGVGASWLRFRCFDSAGEETAVDLEVASANRATLELLVYGLRNQCDVVLEHVTITGGPGFAELSGGVIHPASTLPDDNPTALPAGIELPPQKPHAMTLVRKTKKRKRAFAEDSISAQDRSMSPPESSSSPAAFSSAHHPGHPGHPGHHHQVHQHLKEEEGAWFHEPAARQSGFARPLVPKNKNPSDYADCDPMFLPAVDISTSDEIPSVMPVGCHPESWRKVLVAARTYPTFSLEVLPGHVRYLRF